jgi:hypothetical protein
MELLGLLVLVRLWLCGNIGSAEGDLTSRKCKRHQKNLMDRGNVRAGERKGDFERRKLRLYMY